MTIHPGNLSTGTDAVAVHGFQPNLHKKLVNRKDTRTNSDKNCKY